MEELKKFGGDWSIKDEENRVISGVTFKTLEVGDNVVRFIGNYVFRNVHYISTSKIRYIICCGEDCPLCAAKNNPRLSYYCNIYDRSDKKVKILRFGVRIRKALYNLYRRYGDLSNFDIIITREGTGLDSEYTVLPLLGAESQALSKEDIEIIQKGYINLEEHFKIPTPQEISELLTSDAEETDEIDEVDITSPLDKKQKLANGAKSEVNNQNETVKCFGKLFNPLAAKCKVCTLAVSCRTELLKSIS